MGAPDILALLAARGLSIRPLPGGLLEVSPKARLTDELRGLIRAHRSEIIAALGRQPESDRAAKLAQLRELVLDLVALEPQHWTARDISEALTEGERDLDAAIQTWREILARLIKAQRESYEERAAILEFDAGLSREDAERKAWAMVYGSRTVH